MHKIIFVTQSLDRTGSEMVLWYLLTNLDPKKYAVFVFCLAEGELYKTLPSHMQKCIPYGSSGKKKHKILIRVLKILGINVMEFQVKRMQKKFQADIWYFNSIVMPEIFEFACKLDVKIITHFHELLHAYTFIRNTDLKRIISYSGTCIACSPEVRDKITEMGHRDVRIQYSFIDTGLIHIDPARVDRIKEDLGILPSDFVWIVSGVATYMKGLDRILPILEAFKNQAVKIVWIGRLQNDGLEYYIKRVAETKYPGKLIFTGALSGDYYNHMSVANGFLLLSREESFSLAMVEAAYLGIPIVAVDAGIASSLIREGMGKVVEGCHAEEIVGAMEWLHHLPVFDKDRQKQSAMEYTVHRQLLLYERLIDEIAASSKG